MKKHEHFKLKFKSYSTKWINIWKNANKCE